MIRTGGVALRSIISYFSVRRLTPHFVKPLSTNATSGDRIDDKESPNSFESRDEFEHRIFGGISGSSSATDSFFQKLDRLANTRNRTGSIRNEGDSWEGDGLEGIDESSDSLSDRMDEKLRKWAEYFGFDPEETEQDGYEYRPDVNFQIDSTYDIKDLDLRKPGVRKPVKRPEFKVTTEEVLRKADFRNVEFLANFITEAGIIIKRSQTGISAKAQRKVAREIKTARAFGLMPFTTMGTKSFVFGKTMEHLDRDFAYASVNDQVEDDANVDPQEN
ncbi:hypothetical protein P3X46_024633 [Hevea brasiliensis]|uniref:Small ribosomal subunit protein bS18c n=1 Tax=Hevea brasiliensis TaxID=3981 RepID=A0ABQ9L333_HEVBR|nr:uncharacterized protein LOC110634739 [Hevea brasiliensis]KAJ9159105.1 hypothetical protein P3X46_024633 [Hevea brasiliensis]